MQKILKEGNKIEKKKWKDKNEKYPKRRKEKCKKEIER